MSFWIATLNTHAVPELAEDFLRPYDVPLTIRAEHAEAQGAFMLFSGNVQVLDSDANWQNVSPKLYVRADALSSTCIV